MCRRGGEASWVDRRIFLSKDWILGRFCACAPTHTWRKLSIKWNKKCFPFFYLTIFFFIWLFLGSFSVCYPVESLLMSVARLVCPPVHPETVWPVILCCCITFVSSRHGFDRRDSLLHQKTGLTDKKSQKGGHCMCVVCVWERVWCVCVWVCMIPPRRRRRRKFGRHFRRVEIDEKRRFKWFSFSSILFHFFFHFNRPTSWLFDCCFCLSLQNGNWWATWCTTKTSTSQSIKKKTNK